MTVRGSSVDSEEKCGIWCSGLVRSRFRGLYGVSVELHPREVGCKYTLFEFKAIVWK